MHFVRNEVPAEALSESNANVASAFCSGVSDATHLVAAPAIAGRRALRGDREAADPEQDDDRRECKAFHAGNPIK
jgi:hypothetical protein